MSFLRSHVCSTHEQSLPLVKGVYFTLGHEHLIFLEIAEVFFQQQSNNFQFLNSSRMELCLMESWWMGVLLFRALTQLLVFSFLIKFDLRFWLVGWFAFFCYQLLLLSNLLLYFVCGVACFSTFPY